MNKLYKTRQKMNLEVPKKLYKFFSLDNKRSLNKKKFNALKDEKLWFAKPVHLNDPYEFEGVYIEIDKLVDDEISEYDARKFELLLNSWKTVNSVVSLTKNDFNHLPMWAYYSNNHQGFCVEYEVISPDHIYPINYVTERISVPKEMILTTQCTLAAVKGDSLNLDKLPTNADDMLHDMNSIGYTKHKSWESENEYRVFLPCMNKNGQLVKITQIGLKTSSIIAGKNCSVKHIKDLTKISYLLNCGEVKKCKISDSKFVMMDNNM